MSSIQRRTAVWFLALCLAGCVADGEPSSTEESEVTTVRQAMDACTVVNPPVYRGSPVPLNTRSHGGGYSQEFGEFWYPAWSGSTIYRYDRDNRFLGTFTTGRNHIMQLWGDTEDYYTAHWDHRNVSRWRGRSNTEVWTVSVDDIVGGVTVDENFVYAMAYQESVVWKLNKTDGSLVEEITLPPMAGTLYGGLAYHQGHLYVGRHTGLVHRVNLENREIVDSFETDANIYNMSFDGSEYCVSPNTSSMFCYQLCNDPLEPRAVALQVSTNRNTTANVTLRGTDDNNRELEFEILARPEHGSLLGTAPNLTFEPINEFVGFDSFTYRVNNGIHDSPIVSVNITVLPGIEQPEGCERLHPPRYRGSLVNMNTVSHGGGYSPAFGEYWYPAWSGTTIYRYDKDHQFLGTFRTGRGHVMQLSGETDGSYYTAHWDYKKVSKWQALSSNLIWTTDLGENIGGVTSDNDFVYAMHYQAGTLWKLDKDTGSVVEEITVPTMAGTLYGGLVLVDGILYVGRHHGLVYRINLETRQIIDTFGVDTNIYNMSFDGYEYCASANNSSVFCYAICDATERPRAVGLQVSTNINTAVDLTLDGTDPEDRDLTFELVTQPQHGSLSGTAPNLTYTPIREFTGFDAFSYKVNNGETDSTAVSVNIAILPDVPPRGECDRVNPPRYRGGLVRMNTRSHGGGYSPAFEEYWYPQWAGTQIYRYNKDHQLLGSFQTGRDHVMQLHGLRDGTYLTAHWDRRKVARWQPLSNSLVWSLDVPAIVGGVTADEDFAYAIHYTAPTIWKIDLDTGELVETITTPSLAGTSYGGLELIDGVLYSGRHHGVVYRINLSDGTIIDQFSLDTNIYNMSFNGNDYCASPNSDTVYCYTVCQDRTQPVALSEQVTTRLNNGVDITLRGTDPNDADLTFTVVSRPESGSLTGTAPNLHYEPITDYVGFDSFTFKVNNGEVDSPTVQVNITILPEIVDRGACDPLHPPRYRGGQVEMNTVSHGGGYSPAFREYWYPAWAGTAIYRYDSDYQFIGTFRTGRDHVMQLHGLEDGTYVTAHWDRRKVARWQALGANLVWSVDAPDVVGGVTADENFVYAMAHQASTMWKINRETGELVETFTLADMAGTLYGGLAIVGSTLYVGRHHGVVYRFNLENRELIDSFTVDTNIYNASFDGNEYCVSPNSQRMFCYTLCDDTDKPTANAQQISTRVNVAANITLTGTDPNNRNLTYTVATLPSHGSLTGTVPNLTYTPITDFTGADSFTFRVNNGQEDSTTVRVNITILPAVQELEDCDLVHPPRYVGGLIEMNTVSHGGGYSPAFEEYWYPAWSGTTIYRYDKGHRFLGTFRTGRDHVMQLTGLSDGSYVTAHWDRQRVSRWQAQSDNLIWSTDLGTVIGGVAADESFIYAMAHTGTAGWKLNRDTGEVVEQFTAPTMAGTLYGGLAIIDGILYAGRHHGVVYRINLQTMEEIDTFTVDTNLYNMSFNGHDYCVSPNNASLYCYTTCNDPNRPTAHGQQVTTPKDTAVNITLRGTDQNNRQLTYELDDRPDHGSLSGTAPTLRYEPIEGFTGVDSFTFKVNNGLQDSPAVSVTIAVLPAAEEPEACQRVNPPRYAGAPVTMNSRSHGGGYSPAFNEHWYPAWSGTTVYRYDQDHQFIGTFRTGRDQVMQLTGLSDGTYVTAHWDRRKVARWQALSANLVWSTDMSDVVGGVTADDNYVYAMAHSAPTLWKLDIDTGALVETYSLQAMGGTLYGGLVLIDGILYVGRHDGTVHRIHLQNRTVIDTFRVAANIYNMSWNGNEYCVSPNSDSLYCYTVCDDPDRPTATAQRINTDINTAANITLAGTDPEDRDLTFTIVSQPTSGRVTGDVPNVTYTPDRDFIGFDSFEFRVNNGVKDSAVVRVTITVLPDNNPPDACELRDTPLFRGAPVTMNTRSHGGGYSPAYAEYWYPHWSGSTIYRYNLDHEQVGFFNAGRGQIMQLTGLRDGTYVTAHWGYQNVSRWQGLSDDVMWTTDLGATVGGVAVDDEFAYAMPHTGNTVWKLRLSDGVLVETFNLSGSMGGTLYGGLTVLNGVLYLGRSNALVYKAPLDTRAVTQAYRTATNIYSSSFNGYEYCVSPNTDQVYCYRMCDDEDAPVATAAHISTRKNTPVEIVLAGTDSQNRALTYTVVNTTEHGSLTGTAPNFTYTPISDFVGSDALTFRVHNGVKNSTPVAVTIAVLPPAQEEGTCRPLETPRLEGGQISMNTRSYGGGYSKAYDEYWYPAWSGARVYRFSRDRREIGSFTVGAGQIMQLWAEDDGTFYTANWGLQTVNKWQGLNGGAIWTTNLGVTVGGVTADDEFVYAMASGGATVWKLNKTSGAIEEQWTAPSMGGTLYGGMAVINGQLWVGRSNDLIYRVDLETRQLVDTIGVAASVRNMAYDGQDYCISANNNILYCYRACVDTSRPSASGQQVSTRVNTAVDVTLQGTDPEDRDLTFTTLTRPAHGSLTGTAPNLNYEPIRNFTGSDSFTFKVNNGLYDSPAVRVNVTVLPDVPESGECSVINPPTYRGSPVSMTTHSYGGGYSPAFDEYWYPAWSGTTVYRYDRDRRQKGYFITGRSKVMQLTGLTDGSYVTAHWDSRSVARWQALSSNLIWTTELDGIVGGVAAEGNVIYAMDYRAPTLWKLNKDTGALTSTVTLPSMSGTLYGGLAMVNGVLHVGRDNGRVHRINPDTGEEIDNYSVATGVRNVAFDGQEYCISPNSNSVYCYRACADPTQPVATGQRAVVRVNQSVGITLAGTDPEDRALTFEVTGRPRHGSLSGTAPNLTYTPITEYIGFDSFSFKVNNGIKDSPVVRVNISILPDIPELGECQPLDPPQFRGGAVTMNTRSYGGGFSPAFDEYWYPQWSGGTVYRYDRDRQPVGQFNLGQSQIMQLWGDADGTIYTAHWGLQTVAKWQGLSNNTLWTTSLGVTVGGVTADENFVYAMGHSGSHVWKLNKENGAIVEEFDLGFSPGHTLYGGLAMINGVLHMGRSNGVVYRVNVGTRELINQFSTATTIRNMSWDGTDLCVSNNTDSVYCYGLCDDATRPTANGAHVSTRVNTAVDLTLSATDPEDRDLTFTVVRRPLHGSLTGTAPNLTYTPITDRVGIDYLTFKVNNGIRDSATTTVNIAVLPEAQNRTCNPLDAPRYRGSQVELNTRSHGGGWSPAFREYWYPQWSGQTIYRYDEDYRQIGSFNTGQGHIMQLWGEEGGTYLTAHWDYKTVARWQGLSDNLLWTADVPATVGGVTSDENFAYAMHYTAPTVWKINLTNGVVVETIELEGSMSGTLYGGLALADGVLYVGRHDGNLYKYNLETGEQLSRTSVNSNIYNMSYNGRDYCVSPNSSSLFCYSLCDDPERPSAVSQQVATEVNTGVDITLSGSDPNDGNLTYILIKRPVHGSLTGTAPNLRYTPIAERVGIDSFTFKVNNGELDSDAASVNIAVVPELQDQIECNLAGDPAYRGRPVTMNTRSHGGGYSPAFQEYWYPNWSGTQVTRYNRNREFVGVFRTGRDQAMQIWGEPDGSYYTANWGRKIVAKWQGLSDNLIWSADVDRTVGGVTADANFVYAMAHQGTRAWKFNKSTGALVETLDLPSTPGTLYGGLALLDGDLLVGRDNGTVYRIDLENNEIIDTFSTATNVYNMSYNGADYCISNNTSNVYCYSVCSNAPNRRPFIAEIRDQAKGEGESFSLTPVATDDDNDPLTFTAANLPPGLSIDRLTGEISGTVADGAQAGSPYTVSVTANDGLASYTAQFRFTVYDPSLDAPVFVTRTPENGWTRTAFVVRAHVTDNGCDTVPIVFVQGRALETTTTVNSDGGWNIVTGEVSGLGLHDFSLRVRSACSDKTGTSRVLVGVDTVKPTLNLTVGNSTLKQDGVELDDVTTYPALGAFDKLLMLGLTQDNAAGVHVAGATVTPIELVDGAPVLKTEDRVTIHTQTVAPVSQTPPTGPTTARVTYCTNSDHCSAGRLNLATFDRAAIFELSVTVADRAGNSTEQKYRFSAIDLRAALLAWRTAVQNTSTDSDQAQAELDRTDARLGLALLALDEQQTGNLFLALEDASGFINRARVYDSDIDYLDETLLVGRLAVGWFENLLEVTRARVGEHTSFGRADTHVTTAKAAMDLEERGSAQAAFLQLANGFFWMENGRDGLVATNLQNSYEVMLEMLNRMDAYIAHDPELPGRDEVSQARTDLTALRGYLQRIAQWGRGIESDLAHVEALLTLADAAESIKAAEESTAWVRQYQWGLTQIVYILAEAGLFNAGTVIGHQNPVIAQARTQLEIADTHRRAFRADDFMSLLIAQRCVIVGLYNLAYEPDVETPESCCVRIREFNGLDDRVPVPDHCAE